MEPYTTAQVTAKVDPTTGAHDVEALKALMNELHSYGYCVMNVMAQPVETRSGDSPIERAVTYTVIARLSTL